LACPLPFALCAHPLRSLPGVPTCPVSFHMSVSFSLFRAPLFLSLLHMCSSSSCMPPSLSILTHTLARTQTHHVRSHIHTKMHFLRYRWQGRLGGRERQKWSRVGWSLVLHWHIQNYKSMVAVAREGSWQQKAGAIAFKVLRWSQLLHTGRMFARLVSGVLIFTRSFVCVCIYTVFVHAVGSF